MAHARTPSPWGGASPSGLAVQGDSVAVFLLEQLENLARFGMSARLRLRIQKLPVDSHVEHALRPGRESEGIDYMLVTAQDVACRAHGTGEIVSGDAVGDVDYVQVLTSRRD